MSQILSISTPAMLFPAISLLFLAYTNRFLVLAQLIRQLHGSRHTEVHDLIVRQIANLRLRIVLIKAMQALGVLSFILCAASMYLLFHGQPLGGEYTFGASLISLIISLLVSLWEILISTKAIEIELEDVGRGE
ncbi:MAG TPA: DUF2721 domain-containing protein [Fibrobacteraceae bacterium]|nr:DUF2721 domain-containing protein [Fibrobacteraceae bacterium]